CLEDIRSTQESFIAASGRARKAGFDGVELHGAHGYLAQEFISPALNKRTDRYGGSTENRLRFVQEIIDGIRGSTETALGIRLSLYEDDPDGYPPEYGLKCAESLENIDYVHFSAGRFA
ncbi:MAG: NADH:flavin oxidoreductase, partial [Candidatus Thermoplasmatota archaeon]|nr:NADH:flavin oxidoreductase [Candidatus Thermoplasmatota archaeon]